MDPVTARAWITQESLLAPRILAYSYQSLAWSCRKTTNSNGGPSREWYDFQDRVMWAKLQEESDPLACLLGWNRLVESYTSAEPVGLEGQTTSYIWYCPEIYEAPAEIPSSRLGSPIISTLSIKWKKPRAR
jgi:hypothetical protein